MVNRRDRHIAPEPWIAFASQGRKTNLKHSLGTMCYDAAP